MAPRKRKSPDRRKAVRQPRLLTRLVSAAGQTAARHPKPVFGVMAFGVVFSFVAANALWYQPGGHPAPFLATRDSDDPNAIAGYRPMRRVPPENVTTFRIERIDPDAPVPRAPTETADPAPPSAPAADITPAAVPLPRPETIREAQPVPAVPPERKTGTSDISPRPAAPAARAVQSAALPPAAAQPAKRTAAPAAGRGEDPVAAAIRAAERSPVMRPPGDIPNTGSTPRRPQAMPVAQKPASSSPSTELVLQIQRGLSNIAYADVAVDGVAGEQTRAAIRRFEKHYRLPETGEPNAMVLKKLKSIGAL